MKAGMLALLGLGAICGITQAHAGTPPKTLFEVAGANQKPARLSNGILLIIDAQREYVDGGLPLMGMEAAIGHTARLLARARKAGTPVIHIVHRGGRKLFNPEGRYFEIVPALKPVEGETLIEKTRVSSFAGTPLDEAIKRTGRTHIIVVGFMTHNCVSSTVRAARDLGYDITIVAEATATRDLPDGTGGTLPASAIQASSLAALADRNAMVVQRESSVLD